MKEEKREEPKHGYYSNEEGHSVRFQGKSKAKLGKIFH